MLKIYAPSKEGIAHIAANEFQRLYHESTGIKLEIITRPSAACAMVVLGSDVINRYAHEAIMDGSLPDPQLRMSMDDYAIYSFQRDGQQHLCLAGGRPRALMYAVYDFFAQRAGCRYFWDGDIIPKRKEISIANLAIREQARFEYRGLRYFPHRSLRRFQAQQWTWEDWKQEIDYLLKKRFNLFWMRIGFDDLFQKAFPDIVPYPGFEWKGAVPRSYDDHTLFWTLEYRGQLRKKVLEYARERDLLHPEDIGTMTHWYTRTPQDYLDKVRPASLPQSEGGYTEPSGQVWDIREDENLQAYFKLTETHIREYGEPTIFHTMGLSERQCYDNRKQNQKMKLYTYRRIIDQLRGRYPNAPLLVGSWDFLVNWKPEEVRQLVAALDPSNTIVLEYTTDINSGGNDFTQWGLVGKFPWIMGFFHGNQYRSEIHQHYDLLEARLPVAVADPFCKGLLLWPEHAHCDTFFLEYLAANAWHPTQDSIIADTFLRRFCAERYTQHSEKIQEAWRLALALFRTDQLYYNDPYHAGLSRVFMNILKAIYIADTRNLHFALHRAYMAYTSKRLPGKKIPAIFQVLADLARQEPDTFLYRDIIDLGKTTMLNLLDIGMAVLLIKLYEWREGTDNADEVRLVAASNFALMQLFASLLGAHTDHSLYQSLLDIQSVPGANPDFESTLKGNAANGYCRSFISELFTALYIPEMAVFNQWVEETISQSSRPPLATADYFTSRGKEILDHFFATPLQTFAPDITHNRAILPDTLEQIAAIAEKTLSLPVTILGIESKGKAVADD